MKDKKEIQEEKPKKRFFRFDIIILIILLIVAGIVAFYYFKNPSIIGSCNQDSDCGRYNVFYIKGTGYVCANKILAEDNAIKTRVSLFRFASQNAIQTEPQSCSCIQNQCKINN